MVVYADSSFLVSLYIKDANTPTAETYFRKNPHPVVLTSFSRAETQHAMRMCGFRGIISEEAAARVLLLFERDQEEGIYEFMPLESDALFERTTQLSHRYALSHGVRFLDVVHIAAALLIRSQRFLTFDERQGKLAKSVGLEVRP